MNATTKSGAVVRSVCTTVQKMMVGMTDGYRYKIRLVYAHFPINASITENNKVLEIRNFLGEKIVRKIKMRGDTKIVPGDLRDEYYIEGNNLRDVSQSAASCRTACLVRRKDIRKFLDGVYVWAKGPKGEERVV